MRNRLCVYLLVTLLCSVPAWAETHRDHPAPERLGAVDFETTCADSTRIAFNRAVALLHSFAYTSSEQAFKEIALKDPRCAMAYWGMAMTHYHEVWAPPSGDGGPSIEELRQGAAELKRASEERGASPREHQFIVALAQYYTDADSVSPIARAERYSRAMANVAKQNPNDDEAQIFYALSLIATASPQNRSHANQKQAATILEPIWRRKPEHPGIAHYLIHAYDSAELAPRGLAAARAYSKIAPSAPHALHMPSHIFTRLGLWNDSVASNVAARAAAHAEGDTGEELHAMDYLTYAYLQLGHYADATDVVAAAGAMTGLEVSEFKIGYAATAMPVRLAVERGDWDAAQKLEPMSGSPPHVMAIVYWARALGHSRVLVASSPDADIEKLQACRDTLRASGKAYWATLVDAMLKEALGWQFAAQGHAEQAIAALRAAADEEESEEKLPVTPGPVVPAREQLGELMLNLKHPDMALAEFKVALALAPNRRGALLGAISAAKQLGDTQTVRQLEATIVTQH